MNCPIKQEEARLRAEAAALYAHYERVVHDLHEMDGEGHRVALHILNESQMAEMCADQLVDDEQAKADAHEDAHDANQMAMAIQEPSLDERPDDDADSDPLSQYGQAALEAALAIHLREQAWLRLGGTAASLDAALALHLREQAAAWGEDIPF